MKRLLVVTVIAALLGSALPVEAKKPKKVTRKLTIRYDQPAIGAPGAGGVTLQAPVATGPKEQYLSIKQTDDISPLPSVRFSWDTDGDGTRDTGVNICGGQTEEPIEIPAGVELGVFPYLLPGPGCPTSFNTSGTIELTLSNLP